MKWIRLFVAVFVLVFLLTLGGAAGAQEPQPARDEGLAASTLLSSGCVASGAYDPACDVNHDDKINIVDIELAASHWGHTGTWSIGSHDHWGEAWSGSGSGLELTSSNGTPMSVFSPGGIPGPPALVAIASPGLHAVPQNSYGVYGLGDLAGVYGVGAGTTGTGVWGTSGSGDEGVGVTGKGTGNGYGGFFESSNDHKDLILGGAVGRINTDFRDAHSDLVLSSNRDAIVRLDNDAGENGVFRIKNSGGADVCTVTEWGDLSCIGAKNAVVETAGHGRRLLYAVESPGVWFEDFGTATLLDGEVKVTFEPIFAETVDLGVPYHVFLTPLCQEPVLLFVTAKSATGFTVRGVTLEGQPARCSVDYRIVAKRLGYENVRLERVAAGAEER